MDFGKRFAVGAMKSVIQKVNSEEITKYKCERISTIKTRFNKMCFTAQGIGTLKINRAS